jgi:hypothetical protein
MRGLASYLLAGILVMMVLDFVAPPVGLGLAVGAPPVTERFAPAQSQFVDRTNKGDRLIVPAYGGKPQAPEEPPLVLIGCDPAFSPLSASASANNVRRCVAELAHPLAG